MGGLIFFDLKKTNQVNFLTVCLLDKENIVLYGCTNHRSKKNEIAILWNDKTLNIKWPTRKPIISSKDKNNITFRKFEGLY